MSNHIAIATINGIQTIRLQRPDKMNALTNDMYQQMADALKNSNRQSDIKVNMISGEKGCFTAGNDIKDFLAYAETGNLADGVIDFLTSLGTLDKPLILAIDGPAIGIGTTMAFHADLVYATSNALFQTPFLDLGLIPEAASSYLMPKSIGYVRAYEMLALGEPFPAEKALNAGIINAIVDSDQLDEHVQKVALRLAKKPIQAMLTTKRLMRGDREKIMQVMEVETEIFARQLRSEEAKSAFAAFLNKSAKS